MRRELKKGRTYFGTGGHAIERRDDGKTIAHTKKGPERDGEGKIAFRADAFIDIDDSELKSQGHKFVPTKEATDAAMERNKVAADLLEKQREGHNAAMAKEIAKSMKPEDLKILLGAAANKMAMPDEAKTEAPKGKKPPCEECGGPAFATGFKHVDGCKKKRKR